MTTVSANESKFHRDRGAVLFRKGLLVAAQEDFEQWFSLVETSGDPGLMIPPLNGLVQVAWARGEREAAVAILKQALRLAQLPKAPRMDQLRVYLNAMMVNTTSGRLSEALGYARQALAWDVFEHPELARGFWLNLSVLHWRRQDWVHMLEAADRALKLGNDIGDAQVVCRALTHRGVAHVELGRYSDAQADLTRALDTASDAGLEQTGYISTELGRLHYLKGDFHAALNAARKALTSLLTQVSVLDKEEVARVSSLFGRIFAQYGQRNIALKYLNRAAAYYSQLGLRGEWTRATDTIGRVLSQPARPAGAALLQEVQKLDLVGAVLDMIDDLESVDAYLRGHSERVAVLAVLLGRSQGLSHRELQALNLAGQLHDIGMIAVDADLIRRHGPLSPAEKARVALHTVIGEEMLSSYGLSRSILDVIRNHHERFDGKGSPDGLVGESISLMARIVTVADVYDAMTSDRSYRRAKKHSQAVEELRTMAGRELDPVLTEQFLSLHMVTI